MVAAATVRESQRRIVGVLKLRLLLQLPGEVLQERACGYVHPTRVDGDRRSTVEDLRAGTVQSQESIVVGSALCVIL